jgi:hypothetical protein
VTYDYAKATDNFGAATFTSTIQGGMDSTDCAVGGGYIYQTQPGGYFHKVKAFTDAYFSIEITFSVGHGLTIYGDTDAASKGCFLKVVKSDGKYHLECGFLFDLPSGSYLTLPAAPKGQSSGVLPWADGQQVTLVFTRTGSRIHVYWRESVSVRRVLIEISLVTDSGSGGPWDQVMGAFWWVFPGESAVRSFYYRPLKRINDASTVVLCDDQFVGTEGAQWVPVNTTFATGTSAAGYTYNSNRLGITSVSGSGYYTSSATEWPLDNSAGITYWLRFRYWGGPLRMTLPGGQLFAVNSPTFAGLGYTYCFYTTGKSETVSAGSAGVVSNGDYFHFMIAPAVSAKHTNQFNGTATVKVWKRTTSGIQDGASAADFQVSQTLPTMSNLTFSPYSEGGTLVLIDDLVWTMFAPTYWPSYLNVTPDIPAASSYAAHVTGNPFIAKTITTNSGSQLQFFDFYDKVYR